MRAAAALSLLALVLGVAAAGCGPTLVWYGKSPDRRHRVELIAHKGKHRMRVDAGEGATYDFISPESVTLSGSHLAYSARRVSIIVFGETSPLSSLPP